MGQNERKKIVMTDDEIVEFIDRSRTATMATVLADGRPHLVAMWYAVLDGEIPGDPALHPLGQAGEDGEDPLGDDVERGVLHGGLLCRGHPCPSRQR